MHQAGKILFTGILSVSSLFAEGSAAGFASVLQTVANAGMQVQQMNQSQKQSQAEAAQAQSQASNAQNANNADQRQGAAYTQLGKSLNNPVNKGFPILDPYATPGYWQARSTQFNMSMNMIVQTANAQNQAAKAAIEAEGKKTQMMLQAVGGIMKTAGEQMEKSGAAAAEAEKGRQEKEDKKFASRCVASGSCTKDEKGNFSYKDKDGKVVSRNVSPAVIDDATNAKVQKGKIENALAGIKQSDGSYKVDKETYHDPNKAYEAFQKSNQAESHKKGLAIDIDMLKRSGWTNCERGGVQGYCSSDGRSFSYERDGKLVSTSSSSSEAGDKKVQLASKSESNGTVGDSTGMSSSPLSEKIDDGGKELVGESKKD